MAIFHSYVKLPEGTLLMKQFGHVFLPNEAQKCLAVSFSPIQIIQIIQIIQYAIPWKPFQLPFIFWGWVSTTNVGPHSVSLLPG